MKIKAWITSVVKQEGKRIGDIAYMFCDDEQVLEANISYLEHDTYTDIITFDYVEGDVVSGDILISVDRVKENANLFQCSFEQELHRVIIHGILHLLGVGDKTEEEAAVMRKREEMALALWNEMNMFHEKQ
ncbi:MAG: rRNA maturation RNase YbeY [Bacteroidales bacterium]|jgi:rRNA maturation RNase YbeY|nr:rRNA maturation RNase YbeY [Bacteroidales bacterium]MBR5832483.1 rRNA maturation RNase YbeY [Bacteroidales bacterium]